MATKRFLPFLGMRSASDAGRGVLYTVFLLTWLFAGAVALTMLSRGVLLPLLWVIAPFAWLASQHTRALHVGPQGIEVERTFRAPRHIPWHEVRSIRVVSAWELIVRGWMPPIIHEFTNSMTSEGHVCVTLARGRFYFPPDDLDAFLGAVRKNAHATSYREGTSLLN